MVFKEEAGVKKETEQAKKNKFWMIVRITIVIAALTLMLGTFLYTKGYDLYIGGMIWDDAGFICFLIYMFPVFLTSFIRGVKDRKSKGREAGKWPTYLKLNIFQLLVVSGVLVFFLVNGISRSRKAVIAEKEFDDGVKILLVEDERHFTSTEGDYSDVTVYSRDGIRLKKIGGLCEAIYTNNHMIRDGQYHVEHSGDVVTVYYDYGSLTGGLEWKEEAPEDIIKEYHLDS